MHWYDIEKGHWIMEFKSRYEEQYLKDMHWWVKNGLKNGRNFWQSQCIGIRNQGGISGKCSINK